jgi:tRNA nucleotidyltransferase (CCA-adding enzyme)
MTYPLPQFVQSALTQLHSAGFEAFVVGGSVRDILLGREPKDFDITTNATPEQIQATFSDTLYNNNFGTVAVRITAPDPETGEEKRYEVEITPYRAEAEYSDGRHPDSVTFGVSLEEDLQRRDFTINAMAFDGERIIDLFGGQEDLQRKLIRTVGNPKERFTEDALRMMRAPRFAAQLDFQIEPATFAAITELKNDLPKISYERIRDELMKMIASDDAYRGVWLLYETGLLQHIIPELLEGVQCAQNKHHIYSVFMHNLQALQYAPSDDPLVRLAALLLDVGKPRTKEGEYPEATFHNHEHVGADMARDIMQRLKFSKRDIERVEHLVRNHMFFYSIGEVTDAGVRRLVKRLGKQNIDDFMAVRVGDRMGSGCQKEKPFKLLELERRMHEVEQDPMDTTMLKIDGHDVMRLTGMKPGREIGELMNKLLEDILDDPSLNTTEYCEKRLLELYAAGAKESGGDNESSDKNTRSV